MNKRQIVSLLMIFLVIQATGFGLLANSLNNKLEHLRLATPVPVESAGDPVFQASVSRSVNEAELRSTVRTVLAQELRIYLKGRPDHSRLLAQAKQPTVIQPELNRPAMENAQNIVEQALAKGSWDTNDSEAIHQYLGNLSETQHIHLQEKLYSAWQRHELEMK